MGDWCEYRPWAVDCCAEEGAEAGSGVLERLARANRAQTERCRRMLGGVRLLGDVLEGAEPVDLGAGSDEYVLPGELYERVAAWLADFAAFEATDRAGAVQ